MAEAGRASPPPRRGGAVPNASKTSSAFVCSKRSVGGHHEDLCGLPPPPLTGAAGTAAAARRGSCRRQCAVDDIASLSGSQSDTYERPISAPLSDAIPSAPLTSRLLPVVDQEWSSSWSWSAREEEAVAAEAGRASPQSDDVLSADAWKTSSAFVGSRSAHVGRGTSTGANTSSAFGCGLLPPPLSAAAGTAAAAARLLLLLLGGCCCEGWRASRRCCWTVAGAETAEQAAWRMLGSEQRAPPRCGWTVAGAEVQRGARNAVARRLCDAFGDGGDGLLGSVVEKTADVSKRIAAADDSAIAAAVWRSYIFSPAAPH